MELSLIKHVHSQSNARRTINADFAQIKRMKISPHWRTAAMIHYLHHVYKFLYIIMLYVNITLYKGMFI